MLRRRRIESRSHRLFHVLRRRRIEDEERTTQRKKGGAKGGAKRRPKERPEFFRKKAVRESARMAGNILKDYFESDDYSETTHGALLLLLVKGPPEDVAGELRNAAEQEHLPGGPLLRLLAEMEEDIVAGVEQAAATKGPLEGLLRSRGARVEERSIGRSDDDRSTQSPTGAGLRGDWESMDRAVGAVIARACLEGAAGGEEDGEGLMGKDHGEDSEEQEQGAFSSASGRAKLPRPREEQSVPDEATEQEQGAFSSASGRTRPSFSSASGRTRPSFSSASGRTKPSFSSASGRAKPSWSPRPREEHRGLHTASGRVPDEAPEQMFSSSLSGGHVQDGIGEDGG